MIQATCSNCLVWAKKEVPATVVGALALGALITGIVLAILGNGSLSTGLMATGGAVLAIDLLYVYYSRRQQAQVHKRLGFAPEEVGMIEMAWAANNPKSESAKATAEKLERNWGKAQSKQRYWSPKELAEALGMSPFALEKIISKINFQTTADGRISTQQVNQLFVTLAKQQLSSLS